MKTNAILRIVIYSLVILLLLGLLLMGMGAGMFTFNIQLDYRTGGSSVDAAGIRQLEIDWASGSILMQTADTDQITFTESGSFNDDQAMIYEVKNGTLSLKYSKPAIQIGFVSMPSKDLVITVPQDWSCRELELDGAALDLEIIGLTIGSLDIDGASNTIHFNGAVETVDIDGASCEITMVCADRPQSIDMDGASCQLELTLPADCGFQVQMDGLSCDFNSELNYTSDNGDYMYGDRYCKIDADGMSCEVSIRTGE